MASAKATSGPPPALSFPRPIFAAISPHPFLLAHLSANKTPLRANGRAAHEFRDPGINTGSLTHCNGSAVVRLGNTAVVCGVRAEILKEEDISNTSKYGTTGGEGEGDESAAKGEDDSREIEELRLLVPNVELSTGSTPSTIPGNAPSTSAQTLVTRLRNLLLSSNIIRARDLRITYTPPPDMEGEAEVQVKAYWVLYIDVLFISLDGNAFDAAWLAILAALRDTRLPRAYFDEETESILCSDAASEARKLSLCSLPVPSTFAIFVSAAEDGWGDGEDAEGAKDWILSDPDAFEEGICRETVCIVIDRPEPIKSGQIHIRKIEKSGGGVVNREDMRSLVKRATEKWNVWDKVLNGKA